jgi:FkbM family methyltransferase
MARALPAGGATTWLRRRLRPVLNRLLAGRAGGLRSILPGGETFVVSPEYRHVTWNPEEYEAFRGAVRPGDVVLDVGANVGAYSVLFGQWTQPGGRVFAFEPDPGAFAGLVKHIELNAMSRRVTAVHAAATDGSAPTARLSLGASSGLARLPAGAAVDANRVEVAATSIDEFCRRNAILPRVIKIDVEGAELQVLRGSRQTIAAAGADVALFVEMHPSIWASSGTSAQDVHRECAALGFEAERLDGTARDLWTTEGVCLRLRPRGVR